jgi:2-polyprenyl-3-methyl-5-hydroxy-6-metoxy-1,4-benzoquinol methylase
MTDESKRLQATWDRWAKTDPLFAILSDPNKLGGKWDIKEFMAHTPELDSALEVAEKYGLFGGRAQALDFGCGVGRITQALADHFDKVVGIDISEAMIAQANTLNRHGDRVRYVSGALGQFPDGTFDFAWTIYVIQHIPKSMQGNILRELVRVLKPDGLLMCQIAAPPQGLAKLRTQFGPRWLKELRFKRRYGSAPLIEMNPMHESVVREVIAPARVAFRDGEYFYIRR